MAYTAPAPAIAPCSAFGIWSAGIVSAAFTHDCFVPSVPSEPTEPSEPSEPLWWPACVPDWACSPAAAGTVTAADLFAPLECG